LFSFLKAKTWLAAGGAALLSFLALWVKLQYVENKREVAERKADTLKAQLHQAKVRKKILKEQKEKFVSRTAEIAAQLEKEDEDFTGVDVLSDPNKFD
jgi:hypothetical protein